MRKFFQMGIAMLATVCTCAQSYIPPSFAIIDSNYRTYANNVFGALETNRVSTGLLVDYGFDFTDPRIYNGSVLVDSTLMEQGIFSELYSTLFTSRFNSTAAGMRHPSINDSLCYIARQKEVITLSGLLYEYNAIDPNAQSNGKMQTISGQLRDVYTSGVWQNPYQKLTTMAISPSTIDYKLTYCSVTLPSDLFLSNMGSQVSTIQFDADDGSGYRTLNFDTPINLNYADTGWKHWTFRITLTNSQQLYSHSKVHFDNISNLAGSGGAMSRGVSDRNETITAAESFNGVYGVADISISYRDENDLVLRKPLIIVEGFDPGHITRPEEPEGENTFASFITSVKSSGSSALRDLISGNPFVSGSPSSYDIVYVNWRNGTDWLERNELVLEEVIRWVNSNKKPLAGVDQPNVVLGTSMGGVIARMALGRMDRGGGLNGSGGYAAHETSLYISVDAPHQGANVPLGFQAAARHALQMYVSTGLAGAVEFVQLLRNGPSPLLTLLLADQPAAKELLINRIDFSYNLANTINATFLEDLRTDWDYPTTIRNIAISNGNECAIDQEFTAGSNLIYHYRSTKTRFIGDLIFMAVGAGLSALNVSPLVTAPMIIPGSSKFELTLDIRSLANGGGNQVYYGNIKLTKKIVWLLPVSINIANKTYNAPGSLLPFDTYPGGFYTLLLAKQPGAASQDWMFTYNNSFFIQRRFSFIPTTSALDIGLGNTTLTNTQYMTKYIGSTPPTSPYNTPFDNFTTAYNADGSQWYFTDNTFRELNNEPHEGLYLRSSDWLAQELAGNSSVRTDCSAICENGVITGTQSFCTSQTFTAPAGIGITYTWSLSNPALASLTPSGNTVLVTRTGTQHGLATLTVNISGSCGTRSLQLPIAIGQPDRPKLFDENGSPMTSVNACTYIHETICPVTDPLFGEILEWEWEKVVGDFNLINHGSCADILGYSAGSGVVSIRARNACGWSLLTLIVINVSECGMRTMQSNQVKIYPNPAISTVTFSVNTDRAIVGGKKEHASPTVTISEIKLYDNLGRLKMQRKIENINTVTMNVSGLQNGIYIAEINTSNGKQYQQLIIQK